MFVVFFLLWVVFNGRWSTEIAILGLFVSAALYLFCWKFLDFHPRRELQLLRRIPKTVCYFVALLAEIVRANIRLTRIVLSRKPEIHPQLVTFVTPLESRMGRTVLADSITLTPGTITVSLKEDELTVHCLDRTFAEGIESLDLQRRLLAMEKGAQPHDD
ncbi:MAG: Na+/H+ antiporter subunit E [Eubacteriales bacterium]|nr:Na+/H+ antiporter subunit E [Eubacteriales bacterium]